MFLDFALISGLLVVAHLLRSRIRLFQAILLPTPILAGLIGLAAGPEGLDLIPFARDEGGAPVMRRYPGELVILLFATLFMGSRADGPGLARMIRSAGRHLLLQPVGLDRTVRPRAPVCRRRPHPPLPGSGRALRPDAPLGLRRGARNRNRRGFHSRRPGPRERHGHRIHLRHHRLLAAVLGGVAAINLATRAGWTRLVATPRELPADLRRGLIDPAGARHVGRETVSPLALETFSWHLGLVLLAYGAAHAVSWALRSAGGHFTALPMFALAVICGALLQKLLDGVGVGRHVDRQTMGRLGSSISDFLVAFGVASIPLTIVAEYAAPILVMSAFGFAHAALITWWMARRTFHNYWFERGIFTFGWTTGVVAMGIALLRVVDPGMKSKTLDDYGLAYLPIAMVEIVVLSTLPLWVAGGAVWQPGLLLTGVAAGTPGGLVEDDRVLPCRPGGAAGGRVPVTRAAASQLQRAASQLQGKGELLTGWSRPSA